MRKQQKIWTIEHRNQKSLPSEFSNTPSDNVIYFTKFLKLKTGSNKKVVDIGSGKGRNAIYLAKMGFDVYCLDYIKIALDSVKERAKKNKVGDKVHLSLKEISSKWPFKNNFFDLAIDNFSSIDIETKKGRGIYRKELFRTLKPGGYALVAVVSADDELESGFIKNNPGPEPNSAIWPNGKFQKDYDRSELIEFYKDFEIIKLKKIKKPAFKLGKNYTATNFLFILRKPFLSSSA